MADIQGYKDYLSSVKDRLDVEKRTELNNNVGAYNEWNETGTIGNYFFQPKKPVVEKTPDLPVQKEEEAPAAPVVDKTPTPVEPKAPAPVISKTPTPVVDNKKDDDIKEYRAYLSEIRDTLDKDKLSELSKDSATYEEWKTTGSIGDHYLKASTPIDYFKALQTGQTEGLDTSSAEYKEANKQFKKLNSYINSPDSIIADVANGVMTANMKGLLMENPETAKIVRDAERKKIENSLRKGEGVPDIDGNSNIGDVVGSSTVVAQGLGVDRDKARREIEENVILNENREKYSEVQARIETINQKKTDLRNDIKRRYPTQNAAFLNAMYNKEVGALNQELNELMGEAVGYKNNYDIEMGEIEYILDSEYKASEQERLIWSKQFDDWSKKSYLVDKFEFDKKIEEIKEDPVLASAFTFQNIGDGIVLRSNKQTGEYEFVNIGNIPAGEDVIGANGVVLNENGVSYKNSDLINKYPGEASFKNNNTSGISYSYTSQALKDKWKNAGIEFEEGTARQEGGGNYVSFGTVLDGIEAQRIALEDVGYTSVRERLKAWVGGDDNTKERYARDIMGEVFDGRYNLDVTFDEMSYDETEKLISFQMKRESPGMYKELSNDGIINKDGTLNLDKSVTSYNEVEQSINNDGMKKLGEYLVDTQPRGAGFSNDDAIAFTDAVNKYVEQGDLDTVYQLFRNKILENKNVGPQIYDTKEFIRGLDNLKTTLNEFKRTGDTGILTNIAEKTANFFGRTTADELAKANNQMGVLVADYIRSISGTAASDAEVSRLVKNFPSIKNVSDFNDVILNTLGNSVTEKGKSRLETYLGFKKDLAKDIFPDLYLDENSSAKQYGNFSIDLSKINKIEQEQMDNIFN